MKILVIDDESLVREAVVHHLLQTGVGLADISEAEDGIAGLAQMRSIRPDLIIADIRMPGMNGLELLAKLKEQNDETLFVLLTGYDRFEYVQTALNLGAFSYLLKPFSLDQFEQLILKTKQKLNKRNHEQQSRLQMAIKANEGAMWMKRRFAEELVTQKAHSESYIRNKMEELGIRFEYDSFCVLTMSLDRFGELSEALSPHQMDLIKYGMDNIACEILSKLPSFVLSFDAEDGMSLLVNYSSETVGRELAPLMELCEEVNICILRFLRHEVTVGIGAPTADMLELFPSFESSRQAVMQRLIMGGNRVYRFGNPDATRDKFKVIGFKTEQEMLAAFEKCDRTAALELIQELYTPFFSNAFVDRASLLKLNFQLILLLYKILERLAVNPTEAFGEELTLYEEMNQYSHIDAIVRRFGELLDTGFAALLQEREKGNKRLIEKARHYIHENYDKELSLESVAEHVHLSPTYLSSIFKREYQENFVDYVSNYRIEKAKELLREGRLKVNAVAGMVGIGNVKYFYKVFKKRTGLTPSEYKEI